MNTPTHQHTNTHNTNNFKFDHPITNNVDTRDPIGSKNRLWNRWIVCSTSCEPAYLCIRSRRCLTRPRWGTARWPGCWPPCPSASCSRRWSSRWSWRWGPWTAGRCSARSCSRRRGCYTCSRPQSPGGIFVQSLKNGSWILDKAKL